MSPSLSIRGAGRRWIKPLCIALSGLALCLAGCSGGGEPAAGASRGGPGGAHGSPHSQRPGGGPPHHGGVGAGGGRPERGVPVEVVATIRRPISQFFETHGALEAEREVDLVARLSGPIVELKAEEGMRVRRGQLLARIDDREMRAALAVSEVRLEETKLAYERVKRLFGSELVSQETVDQALANYQSAQGDYERLRVQLQYTEITAPFGGLVVLRYVKFAENLSVNQPLFRLSDFDPLLCPIQVPERELSRLRPGQSAQVQVEAWPEETFSAKVLRISPVVNAQTGTIKVTLEVDGAGQLRPGMFASVFLEVETRQSALVVPKAALALDALEDTVFVAVEGRAQRRSLELGFQNDDSLEVLAGLQEGELVVVVGQDGLSEGTPVEILGEGSSQSRPAMANRPPQAPASQGPASRGAGEGGPPEKNGGRPEGLRGGPPSPERLEQIKDRMRARGLSEDEIKQRLHQMTRRREGAAP